MKINKKLRIAHVVAVFPPYSSGTGNVAYYNALELGQLGHEIHVFTAKYPLNGHRDPLEINVHRMSTPFQLGNAPLTPSLLTLLKGFDLIHLHWPFIFGSELTLMASAFHKIPYIMTYHMDLRANRKRIFGPYQSLWGPLLAKRARKIITVSEDHLKYSLIFPYLKNRQQDIIEIPNGVDPDRFHPDISGHAVRARFGIPENEFVIIFVGAMDRAHEFKGVSELLQTFAELNHEHVWLMLVGSGDLLNKYQSRADQLPVAVRSRVVFTGRVSDQELPTFYAAGDVCVLPSRHTESFGMVLIEAMACGKPVIASNIPGVRSVVDDGVNGSLITPGDPAQLIVKILELKADPRIRYEMGQRGREKIVEKYSWNQIGLQLYEVYQGIFEN